MLREMLADINEAERLDRLKTRLDQTDTDMEKLLNRSPIAGTPHHAVTGAETRQRVSNVRPNEEMMRKMGAIDPHLKDKISDADALAQTNGMGIDPEPVEPSTLPKIISKELQLAGEVVPEWHMVKNLPGYLAAAIRHIGRAVFAPFTRTPIENIQVIANLMSKGPNTAREMNAVAGYLTKHAHRDRDAELIFHDKIPEYGADLKVFKDRGITYMLVHDFAGNYVYAWPSDHEHEKLGESIAADVLSTIGDPTIGGLAIAWLVHKLAALRGKWFKNDAEQEEMQKLANQLLRIPRVRVMVKNQDERALNDYLQIMLPDSFWKSPSTYIRKEQKMKNIFRHMGPMVGESMKLEHLVESKKKRPAETPKALNAALVAKKAGSHKSKKDYKRAEEQRRLRKQVQDES